MTILRIVPWLELSGSGAVSAAVEGLRIWRTLCDSVIVSVGPDCIGLLAELRSKVPNIRYIPGLKTASLLTAGFDDADGWKQIGALANELRQATDSRMLLLENETASKPYAVDGTYTMDWRKFATAIGQLPRRLTYLWSPCTSKSTERMARYVDLCRCAEDNCRVVWIDQVSLQSPQHFGMPVTIRAAAALREVASQTPVCQILAYPDTHWPYERVPEAVAAADADWVIVYPGASRWVEASNDLTARLRGI